MSSYRILVLIVTLSEIVFGLYGLTRPLGFDGYSAVIDGVLEFRAFLLLMSLAATTFLIMFLRDKELGLQPIVSGLLTGQWFSLLVTVAITGFFTFNLPLIIMMFFIQVTITAVSATRGSNAIK